MTLIFLVALSIIIYYFVIYKETYKNIFGFGDSKNCPNCGNRIEENYNVCPVCKETLKKKCDNCQNMVDLNWKYCPYCEEVLKNGENSEK